MPKLKRGDLVYYKSTDSKAGLVELITPYQEPDCWWDVQCLNGGEYHGVIMIIPVGTHYETLNQEEDK